MKTTSKYFWLCTLVLVLLSFSTPAQNKSSNLQTIDGKKYFVHQVEKGQSLYAIAKLYSTTLETLYEVNPELKTGARAGQEIRIPVNAQNAPAVTTTTAAPLAPVDTARFLTHRIQKGETVYAIGKKYKLSEKQLYALNPGLAQGAKEGQLIAVGEKAKRKSPVPVLKELKAPPLARDPRSPLPAADSALLKPVSKPKKTSYNVALVLPFRADQTLAVDLGELLRTNSPFPPVPALAIDFYMGFRRAVDSLSSADFRVNIEVYDIDDKDSARIVQLANSARFKEFDLVFGPLYANGFKSVAKKAKELNIPIVSPITTQNKILYNNNYISKTNPSQFTLLEGLADYCMDSLMQPGTNLILVNSEKDKKEQAFVMAFKKYYNERQKSLGRTQKDTVRLVKGIAGLKSVFNTHGKNVVLTFATNRAFLADFTTQLALSGNRHNCVLCSWQSMSENDNIDQEYLNELNFTFPHPYNLINTSVFGQATEGYRQKLGAHPGEFFFIGHDVALYYLRHLKAEGPDFIHNLTTLPDETSYLRFKFTRPDLSTGFDNRGLYIFRYSNYQLQKTGWK